MKQKCQYFRISAGGAYEQTKKNVFYWMHVAYINLDQAHAVDYCRNISHFIQKEAGGSCNWNAAKEELWRRNMISNMWHVS